MNPLGLAVVGGALWWLSRLNRNPDGAGFRDKNGRFHPIRSSEWYQPSLLEVPETVQRSSRPKQAPAVRRTATRGVQASSAPTVAPAKNYAEVIANVERARNELRDLEDQQGAEGVERNRIEGEWEKARQLEQQLRNKQLLLAGDFNSGLYRVTDPLEEVTMTGSFAGGTKAIADELSTRSFMFPPVYTKTPTSRGTYAEGYIELLKALPKKLEPFLVENKTSGGPYATSNHTYMQASLEAAAKKLKQLKAWDATNKKYVEAVALADSFPDKLNQFMAYGDGWKRIEAARDKVRNAEAAAEAAGVRLLGERFVVPGDSEGEKELAELGERNKQQHAAYLAAKAKEASAKFQKELANETRWINAVTRAQERLYDLEQMRSSEDKPTSKTARRLEQMIGIAKQVLADIKAKNPITYTG